MGVRLGGRVHAVHGESRGYEAGEGDFPGAANRRATRQPGQMRKRERKCGQRVGR